ncbi:hypothetical protein AB0I77_27495 [Streptomyces sp. NPDC050619]|uniref:hypothetical protein n=1 Tax=Streptomyces sp. NPDC050619 TaxID=3157214 RepID=UPI00341BF5B8
MISVTWSDAQATLGGTAQIRTRSATTGRWSPWRGFELDFQPPELGTERAADDLRGGTEPLWVGPSDGVQARITGAKLPAGLRVDLIDPDSGEKESAPAPAGAATAAGQPDIVPRSGWGADESIVADPPTYTTDTKAVFVHHTAGTNDYTCAESASIIRGIFVYHVRSSGWNEIGYNFLVDKCGTVFEGRAGAR